MDTDTLIFLVTMTVLSLGLGISGFIGNKAEGYSYLSFASRLLFGGVLGALILLVAFTQPHGEASDYLLSYICFFLGLLFSAMGIVFTASSKSRAFWRQIVRRNEQAFDRRYLVLVSFGLSFAFFFAFFLFYPPFISIG